MAVMANIGQVVFQVSSKTLRTLDELSRSSSPRWATHDRYLQKPRMQFIGPGKDSISFNVTLDSRFGVDPRKEAERFITLAQQGRPMGFAVGGKKMGTHLWVLTDVQLGDWRINRKGEVTRIVVSLSLEEYAK